MKVIVAEDDVGTRLILEHALKKWEYDVVSTSNGLDALNAILNEEESCLAVLDWVMPEMDGLEVCRIVREKQTARGYTYIVILTGKQRKEDVVKGLEAGADDFLIKPFDHQELRMRLRAGRRILELQEQLNKMAYYDSLTGLLNRLAIMNILRKELERAKREEQITSVIMCDLDYFKKVNDSYGHLCGDAVLQEAASRLKLGLRKYDSIGRYGGEEFLIVVPGCNAAEASNIAKRIQTLLSVTPIVYLEKDITVTMSMGIADTHCCRCDDIDTLVRLADESLYQAKNEGRNRVCLASPTVSK